MGVPSKIVIVGAGISGICAGILLKQAGIDDFVILEKADRIGGTWRDNTYPGAACDIPAHLYSFSFATTGQWQRKYATQPEILAYLDDCVSRFELGRFVRFGAEVVEATYRAGQWHVTLADGGTLQADVLITACGQLHRPYIPDIAGQDTFAGTRRSRFAMDLSAIDLRECLERGSCVQRASSRREIGFPPLRAASGLR